jgi:hypothetical protein
MPRVIDLSQFQCPLKVAGLDGEALALAVRTRTAAVRRLVKLLAQVRYPGVIAGSWAHADFHLLASGESLSDLDLVWLGSSETERCGMIDRISCAGWTGKISIHPTHSFERLSLDIQRVFIIGEHLINVRLHPGPLGHDLSLAKTALLLARQSINERYASVAARRREVYLDALRVKLGVTQSLKDRAALVTATGNYRVGDRRPAEWFELAGEPGAFDEYRELFASTVDTTSWLYSRVLAKLASVSDNSS